jgi:hypothetical protein
MRAAAGAVMRGDQMAENEGEAVPRSSFERTANSDPAAGNRLQPLAPRGISASGGVPLERRLAEEHHCSWRREPSGESPVTRRRIWHALGLFSSIAGAATVACSGAVWTPGPVDQVLALCYPTSGDLKNVSSSSDLRDALSSASPGDHIVVAPGTYSGNFNLRRDGSASNPIVVKAASSSNRPRLAGRFLLEGDYGVLEGFDFTGSGRIEVTGSFNRATRNLVEDFSQTAIYIKEGAVANRVDHNEIGNMRKVGSSGVYGIRINIAGGTKDNRIDHNYLHDFPDQGRNGHEPIRLGIYHPDRLSRTLIDHNLLVRTLSDGETIGIKGSVNRIVNNTVVDGRYASNRQGGWNLWKNNWFENTDLRIYGKGNQIIGNHLVNGAIHLLKGSITQGEIDDALRRGRSPADNEPVAENTLVVGNSGGWIYVGAKYRESTMPNGTRLEANSSEVVKKTKADETAQSSIDYGTVRKLTTSDVGLDAPDPTCQ